MRWVVYKVRKGRMRKLGVVEAKHQPAALREAWNRWPEHIDGLQVQAGFTVRQEV